MTEDAALPQWTPTDEGGVQLDWHEGGFDLEIEFGPAQPDGFVVFTDQRGRIAEWEGGVIENPDLLRRIVRSHRA
jgi:hypothetical protein